MRRLARQHPRHRPLLQVVVPPDLIRLRRPPPTSTGASASALCLASLSGCSPSRFLRSAVRSLTGRCRSRQGGPRSRSSRLPHRPRPARPAKRSHLTRSTFPINHPTRPRFVCYNYNCRFSSPLFGNPLRSRSFPPRHPSPTAHEAERNEPDRPAPPRKTNPTGAPSRDKTNPSRRPAPRRNEPVGKLGRWRRFDDLILPPRRRLSRFPVATKRTRRPGARDPVARPPRPASPRRPSRPGAAGPCGPSGSGVVRLPGGARSPRASATTPA